MITLNTPRNIGSVLLLLAYAAAAAPAAGPVDQLREYLNAAAAARPPLAEQAFAAVPLSKADAEAARRLIWDDAAAALRVARSAEWKAQAVPGGGKSMRFASKTFGTKPKDGWNLFISLHGGGNASPAVNDQQWRNQAILYEPADSLYIAPRAPTDTWNLWHEPHIDRLLERLIEDAILLADVNPNRVYLMGYSAGGDGVYQLAPRMADRFAGAAMMAGHPNDASPLGLRNLPFAIHMGALDNGYRRNDVAREWKAKLDALQAADRGGYVHEITLHDGMGHWMKREDRVAVPWMATFTRDPLPAKIVWVQGHAPNPFFYWLGRPAEDLKVGQRVAASRDGQTIRIDSATDVRSLTIWLNDTMADLDRPIRIVRADRVLFDGNLPRTIATLSQSIQNRPDGVTAFSAKHSVRLD